MLLSFLQRYIIVPIKKNGVALVEIVVSMLILAVSALAVTATVSMVNSKQMRSAGGSSLDLQALSYARETLEGLKNAVSTNEAAGGAGVPLRDTSYGTSCPTSKTAGEPCGAGTSYAQALPATSDLATKSSARDRVYKVWDISGGSGTVAYKKVTVTVTWTDPV